MSYNTLNQIISKTDKQGKTSNYTYVRNNPLKYTDPTGYEVGDEDFGGEIGSAEGALGGGWGSSGSSEEESNDADGGYNDSSDGEYNSKKAHAALDAANKAIAETDRLKAIEDAKYKQNTKTLEAKGGFRSLEYVEKLGVVIGKRGSRSDRDNLMIAHEGFILSDGTIIGFFADGMIRVDSGYNINDYSQLKNYDDDILQQAIGITDIGEYDFIHNNCQDWASRVDKNYRSLGGK